MKKPKGPEFSRFIMPLLEALGRLGGSGRSAEVIDLVLDQLGIHEKDQARTLRNGQSRVRHQVG